MEIVASDVSLNAMSRAREIEKIVGGTIDHLINCDVESLPFEDETFDAVDDQDTVWLDDIYYIMTGKAGSPQKVTASEMKKLVALKDLTEILISLQAQQPGTVLDLKTIRTINPGAFHNLEDPEIEGIISRLKEVSGLQKLEEALIGSAF